MAISTYSELKTAVQDFLHRTDLTAQYDNWIDLTETMLKRSPRSVNRPGYGGVRGNLTKTSGTTMTASQRYVSKPSDLQDALSFQLTATDNYLQYLAPGQMRIIQQTGTGMPKYFTITDTIDFNIAPDSAYAYEILYYPTFPALSDSQTTNWVLTNYPDVYLAGCLYWANRFIQNDQESENWLSQYKQAAYTASETYRTSTVTKGPLQIRAV